MMCLFLSSVYCQLYKCCGINLLQYLFGETHSLLCLKFFLFSLFPYLGSAYRGFVLNVLLFFSLYSFLLCVFIYIAPPQFSAFLSFGVHPLPPSLLSLLLHLPQTFSPYVKKTSVSLQKNLSITSLIFS